MLYRASRMDMRRKSYEKCLIKLNNIIEHESFENFVQQQEVYLSMGTCFYHMEDYESAITWFRKAITRKKPIKKDKKDKDKKDKKEKKETTSSAATWKVSHLLKRACHFMISQAYSALDDPERSRVHSTKASKAIPKRTAPFSPSKKKTNRKSFKGKDDINKKKKKKEDKEKEDDIHIEIISDDEGTTDGEKGEDEEEDEDANHDLDDHSGSNVLDPDGTTKFGTLITKFGSFWIQRK